MSCVNKIKGKRFPSTNSMELTADFTKVSAQEASTSLEADAMPDQWKKISKMRITSFQPQLVYCPVDEAIVKKRREDK